MEGSRFWLRGIHTGDRGWKTVVCWRSRVRGIVRVGGDVGEICLDVGFSRTLIRYISCGMRHLRYCTVCDQVMG